MIYKEQYILIDLKFNLIILKELLVYNSEVEFESFLLYGLKIFLIINIVEIYIYIYNFI